MRTHGLMFVAYLLGAFAQEHNGHRACAAGVATAIVLVELGERIRRARAMRAIRAFSNSIPVDGDTGGRS